MPDTLDTTEAELCIERLAECQRGLQLSDSAFVRRFPALGSARTWRRLALKDWPNVPLEVWLPKLRDLCEHLTGDSDTPSPSAVPTAYVSRHLAEADRCAREKNLTLARSHCRAARQAIEDFQRALAGVPNSKPVTP